jgi:hypothetical protein
MPENLRAAGYKKATPPERANLQPGGVDVELGQQRANLQPLAGRV